MGEYFLTEKSELGNKRYSKLEPISLRPRWVEENGLRDNTVLRILRNTEKFNYVAVKGPLLNETGT